MATAERLGLVAEQLVAEAAEAAAAVAPTTSATTTVMAREALASANTVGAMASWVSSCAARSRCNRYRHCNGYIPIRRRHRRNRRPSCNGTLRSIAALRGLKAAEGMAVAPTTLETTTVTARAASVSSNRVEGTAISGAVVMVVKLAVVVMMVVKLAVVVMMVVKVVVVVVMAMVKAGRAVLPGMSYLSAQTQSSAMMAGQTLCDRLLLCSSTLLSSWLDRARESRWLSKTRTTADMAGTST